MSNPITFVIFNNRNKSDDIQLLLTAANEELTTLGITRDQTIPFDETGILPIKAISIQGANNSKVDGARLYVGSGPLTLNPDPKAELDFGWIEFSNDKDPNRDTVWINLTNVDLLGLPLALFGTSPEGKPWALGYNASKNDIINRLRKEALNSENAPAFVSWPLETPQHSKVVGPNIVPESYASFDTYLSLLSSSQARLVIYSDPPKAENGGGLAKEFTGSFLNAMSDEADILKLTSKEGDVFRITKGDFNTSILYRGDGGKLKYQTKSEIDQQAPVRNLPQNRTEENDPKAPFFSTDQDWKREQDITNSVFRSLIIGMNEGYFAPFGINYSNNFSFLEPFKEGGNQYAKIIHETSNSYGFPYADSNLKVLIEADPRHPIVLSILKDEDKGIGFTRDLGDTDNKPGAGDFNFGIGANSTLGTITLGNCRYVPNPAGAYGGFLPTLEDWTQMFFGQKDHFIWIRTTGGKKDIETGGCLVFGDNNTPLNSDQLMWVKDIKIADGKTVNNLVWPGNVSWKTGSTPPTRPQSDNGNSIFKFLNDVFRNLFR